MKNILIVLLSCCLSLSLPVISYATTTNTETTSQYVKNSTITGDVKARFLADSDISSLHISVKTIKGVVMLKGYVTTPDQKQKAAAIAQKVNGVKSVNNKLIVKKK